MKRTIHEEAFLLIIPPCRNCLHLYTNLPEGLSCCAYGLDCFDNGLHDNEFDDEFADDDGGGFDVEAEIAALTEEEIRQAQIVFRRLMGLSL